MARDHARIKLTIWDDAAWRALSVEGQHLFLTLLAAPSINNAGVADWRPLRIAALAAGWTVEQVEQAGKELESARFIVIDHSTEEVLVRTFVRHDGIMLGPKTAQGMANAYRRVVSLEIRQVIIQELVKLRPDLPNSTAWRVADVVELLDGGISGAIREHSASIPEVSDTLSDEVSREYAGSIPLPSNHQTIKPSAGTPSREKRGTRLPQNWQPSKALVDEVRSEFSTVDLRLETDAFRDYWLAKAGKEATKLDWDLTWRGWMRRSHRENLKRNPRGTRGVEQFGRLG